MTTKLFTRLLPDGTKALAPDVKVLHRVVDALWLSKRTHQQLPPAKAVGK